MTFVVFVLLFVREKGLKNAAKVHKLQAPYLLSEQIFATTASPAHLKRGKFAVQVNF